MICDEVVSIYKSDWTAWTDCTEECDGGVRTRSRLVGGANIDQTEPCNTEICPIVFDEPETDSDSESDSVTEPDSEPKRISKCQCDGNRWSCANACSTSEETCQRISLDSDEMRCIPIALGNCNAWGDPHVVTFDGALNDVYGVATYIFAQVSFYEFLSYDS